MALLKCVECGGQVSSFAEQCPHCGCPISIIISRLELEMLEVEHATMGRGTIVETEYDTIKIQFPNEEKPRRFSKKLVRDKLAFPSEDAKLRFWEHEDAADKEYEATHPPVPEKPASEVKQPSTNHSSILPFRIGGASFNQYGDEISEDMPDYMFDDDQDERMDDNFYIGDGDDYGDY